MLLIAYGGKLRLRTPGVGSVLPCIVVETVTAGVAEFAAAWDEAAAIAEAASVAFVMLKPSGYEKSKAPGSPGRENGGCTGFVDNLPLPQGPEQKLEASLRSIQIPSKGMSLCHFDNSYVQKSCDCGTSQSPQTLNPGQLSSCMSILAIRMLCRCSTTHLQGRSLQRVGV